MVGRCIICLTVAVLIFATVMNYGLALLGEPRALWLFRDVLGVML